MFNRTSRKVKDFTQTPIDYISVDLEYKKLRETTKHNSKACSKVNKVRTSKHLEMVNRT